MKCALGTRRTPIGVDIGCQYIKAVQLRGGPGRWQVEAATAIPRLNTASQHKQSIDTEDVQRLCDVLSRQGFQGRQVVLAVPHDQLISEVLELPSRQSDAPLETIARMELARAHKQEPQSFELCLWDLPAPARAREATHVMAACCPHEAAEALLDTFENCGLDVLALDMQACALARACAPVRKQGSNIFAIFDIGWTAARLIILYDDVIVYERTLDDTALDSLKRALGAKFELDDDMAFHLLTRLICDAHPDNHETDPKTSCELLAVVKPYFETLVRELKMSFSYIEHRYPDQNIGQLCLVGGGACLPQLIDTLQQSLEMDMQVISPASLVSDRTGTNEQCHTPLLTTAMGLAQYCEKP